jgi:hypothetical protein
MHFIAQFFQSNNISICLAIISMSKKKLVVSVKKNETFQNVPPLLQNVGAIH